MSSKGVKADAMRIEEAIDVPKGYKAWNYPLLRPLEASAKRLHEELSSPESCYLEFVFPVTVATHQCEGHPYTVGWAHFEGYAAPFKEHKCSFD